MNGVPIRVVLVDEHSFFREGVRTALECSGEFKIVAEGANAEDALRLADRLCPNFLIMEVRIPGNGIEASRSIAKAHPTVKVVLLTASESEEDLTAGMAAGAKGYVLKSVCGAELLSIVKAIAQGESYASPAMAAKMLKRPLAAKTTNNQTISITQLTVREEQILGLVEKGLSNKEVARKLNISEKTVKHYMTLAMQKLKVRNRVEAVLRRKQEQGFWIEAVVTEQDTSRILAGAN